MYVAILNLKKCSKINSQRALDSPRWIGKFKNFVIGPYFSRRTANKEEKIRQICKLVSIIIFMNFRFIPDSRNLRCFGIKRFKTLKWPPKIEGVPEKFKSSKSSFFLGQTYLYKTINATQNLVRQSL